MKRLLTLLCACCFAAGSHAQSAYVPTPDNLRAREAFRNDRFGIFLHWGLYSMLATGEWTMTNKNLNYKEYAKLAGGFCPARFDAREWVRAIKASGAGYICFTTRHHEGFSMFDTAFSDYNIVDATPFGRDVLRELAEACREEGIGLHLYYSHIDWYREDCPRGRTGLGTGRPGTEGNWESYYAFMNNQLTELLTGYGPIRAVWFDGWWDQDQNPGFDWQLDEQYALVHRLQPACLIANNHHQTPFPGEDIQVFERDLPGENEAGLSGQAVGELPLETCQTMNGMWGYKITDQEYKPAPELIRYLVGAAGRDANLLLNIGPQPDGELPAAAVERLQEIGRWMAVYGPTVRGTRGGPIGPRPWGVTTQRDDRVYVHILELQDRELFVPLTGAKVLRAVRYDDRTPVRFRQDDEGVLLRLGEVPDATDYVVELTLRR